MQLNMLITEESYMGLALMEDDPHKTLGQESTELSSRFFLWQFENSWQKGSLWVWNHGRLPGGGEI